MCNCRTCEDEIFAEIREELPVKIKPAETFTEWLLPFANPYTPIGRFALHVEADKCWPADGSKEDFVKHLQGHSAPKIYFENIKRLWHWYFESEKFAHNLASHDCIVAELPVKNINFPTD